ncbi:hypothetical protein EST38_g7440 [Candolleomyces aberdarensis]|uniref:Nephrocystin 3-like N-terminal domain-containing protein n=1 Tax=Candolleomyces aberdarensis TaxID=2316362 RepID=A0A4Q2DI07_9AGAR|nr:hypothetical protein EST38_g7440 [Candolleomyces aberdarensis]
MDWIGDRGGPQRLLCMTGAAGSGKSALQQTITECCAELGILSAALFFSSEDPTRNTISFVVPTIAYQIGLKHNGFRSSVAAAVKHDPHIFSRSLQSQIDVLIVRPFENLRRSEQLDINTFPYVILIDGLDECQGETTTTLRLGADGVNDRRKAEDRQAELLAAIKHCILDNDLPFRVSIASRPEWAIRTALEPGGYLRNAAYHLQLSDKYDASGDMRRYLWRRFQDIGARIGDSQWFTKNDIEALVRAASGQFVYVAMAYNYISERRASPAERLKIVLTWTPHKGQVAKPFEALDRLYTHILLAAKNAYEAVDTHSGRNFLLLFWVYNHTSSMFATPLDTTSVLLGLGTKAEDNLLSDLHSLVTFQRKKSGKLCLSLYHKSFSDFLREESRANDLFIPRSRGLAHLATCCMHYIIQSCPLGLDPGLNESKELPEFQMRCLEDAIMYLLESLADIEADPISDEVVHFTEKRGWQKVDKLLPLMYSNRGPLLEDGIWYIRNLACHFEVRNPEVGAVISGFAEKWECDEEEWERKHTGQGLDSSG